MNRIVELNEKDSIAFINEFKRPKTKEEIKRLEEARQYYIRNERKRRGNRKMTKILVKDDTVVTIKSKPKKVATELSKSLIDIGFKEVDIEK